MNKRIISLVLALVMVLGTFTSVFAAETNKDEKKAEAPKAGDKVEKIVGKDNKIQYIIDKKFVEGYEDGSYGYDKNIKRAEITRLLVLANGHEELAKKLQGSMRIYSDVDTNHWANGVITVGTTKPSEANGIPFLVGYPDGSFQPEKDVTYAELAKMLVVLVKKDLTKEMHDNAIWASSWMTWAAELGILDDVTIADSNAPATRADAFVMMYNALYKMQEFKRVPANEKIGVLSALKKSELVLNQDKDETYKLTDDTVFVQTAKKGEYSNVVKVKDIKNPDYYLGSLIRIMINDKKEVSHILELGNPKDMALGGKFATTDKVNYIGDNARWKGVADATASTMFTPIASLTDEDRENVESYVTLGFNGKRTKVNAITFHNDKKPVVKEREEIVLDVNSDTKVYVANPANNQMREMKDVNEALSLMGYQNYNGYKIPNVYVGYDKDSHKSAIAGFDTDYNTAKVIVFNVVAKDKGGEKYRVVTDPSSKGVATLEDTDGKLYDKDFFDNHAYYPYNYADLYDVIEVKYFANNNADRIETLIDHSDEVNYPIVEVREILNDKKKIRVVDEFNYTTLLNLKDADIFNAKQYKDLTVGDKVQFATTEKSPTIDVLSILPRDTKVEGSMRDVVKSIYGGTVVAKKVIDVNEVETGVSTIVVDAYNHNFNVDKNAGFDVFYLSKEDAKLVKLLINDDYYKGLTGRDAELVFDVKTDMAGHYGKAYASNFRLNNAAKTPIKDLDIDPVARYKDYVDEAKADYGTEGEKVKDLTDDQLNELLKDTLPTIANLYNNALTVEEQGEVARHKAVYDKIKEVAETEAANRAAQKAYDDFVKEIQAIKVAEQENTVTADELKDLVQTEIGKLTAPEGVTATAVKPDAVEAGKANPVKVTVTSDNDAVEENENVTVNVNVKEA